MATPYKRRLAVPIEPGLHHRLKIQAAIDGISLANFVHGCLTEAIEAIEFQRTPKEVKHATRTPRIRAQQ